MKKKVVKRHLQFNIVLNISVIIGITILATIGYYYSNINYLFVTNDYGSEIILNAFFIIVGVAQVMYVFFNEEKKKVRVLLYTVLGGSIVLFALSLVQNTMFMSNQWYRLLAKVETFFAILLTMNAIVLYWIKKEVEHLTFGSKIQVIDTETLYRIAAKFMLFTGGVTAIPFVVLQVNAFFEKMMLLVLYFIGAAVLAIANYMTVRKSVYEPNASIVEKHQYLTLRSLVLPKEKEQLMLTLSQSEKVREQLNTDIDKLENQREDLVVLEMNTPALEQQLAELVGKISVYDKQAMNETLVDSKAKAEHIKHKIWSEEYQQEHQEKSEHAQQNEEQLKAAKSELTKKNEEVNSLKQQKATIESSIVGMLEEQSDQKQVRHDVTETKASQMQMLGDDTLTDKERRGLNSKIEKQTKKEEEIDVKISKLEDELVIGRNKKEAIEKSIAQLETSEIPDLSYVIQTKEEELTELKAAVTSIEEAYDVRIATDRDLENTYAIIETTTQELKTVAELEAEKNEVHEQLSIDVDKGKTVIDEKVTAIIETIAKQLIIEEQLQKDKEEIEAEIVETHETLKNMFE